MTYIQLAQVTWIELPSQLLLRNTASAVIVERPRPDLLYWEIIRLYNNKLVPLTFALSFFSEFSVLLKMEAGVVTIKAGYWFRAKAFISSVKEKHRSGHVKNANLTVIYYELNS